MKELASHIIGLHYGKARTIFLLPIKKVVSKFVWFSSKMRYLRVEKAECLLLLSSVKAALTLASSTLEIPVMKSRKGFFHSQIGRTHS